MAFYYDKESWRCAALHPRCGRNQRSLGIMKSIVQRAWYVGLVGVRVSLSQRPYTSVGRSACDKINEVNDNHEVGHTYLQ